MPSVTKSAYLVCSSRNSSDSACSVFVAGSQTIWLMPTLLPKPWNSRVVSPRLTRNTLELFTLSGSIAPLNGMLSRGCRLKPSSVLMTSMSWQSESWVTQSAGLGRFTRRSVRWLTSGLVNTSLGNGAVVGLDRSKTAWTPAPSVTPGTTTSTARHRTATRSMRRCMGTSWLGMQYSSPSQGAKWSLAASSSSDGASRLDSVGDGAGTATRQHGEDVREIFGGHGLRQVSVEARLERAPPVVFLPVPADRDEDRRGAAVRADATGDLVAIDPRQPDVDENDIGPDRLGAGDAARAVVRLVDPVALVLEERAQCLSRVHVVLDHEHGRRRAAIGLGGGF